MIEVDRPRTTVLEKSFAIAGGVLIGLGIGSAILGLPLLTSAEIVLIGLGTGLAGVKVLITREHDEI